TKPAKKSAARPAAKSAKKSSKPVEKKQSKAASLGSSKASGAAAAAKSKGTTNASKGSPSKVAPTPSKSGKPLPAGKAPAQKRVARPISGAVKALEAGIKLMYAEQYDKAIKCFNELISDYPDEVEIQASARANIHACENKRNNRAKAVIRTADDHYHMAVAFL